MKLPGTSGEVTAKGHEGWIELNKLEFLGISNNVQMRVGKASDRAQGFPGFGKIVIAKQMDKSSITLFQYAHSADIFKEAEINYVTTGNPDVTYAKLILKDVGITHYRHAYAKGDQLPQEIVMLAYSSIQKTFTPRNKDNSLGSPLTTGYDLDTASQI